MALLAGCATASDRLAVPAQLSGEAAVPGLADVRVWGDANFSRALLQAELPNLKAKYQERAKAGPKGAEPPVSNLLALSGGADDGEQSRIAPGEDVLHGGAALHHSAVRAFGHGQFALEHAR